MTALMEVISILPPLALRSRALSCGSSPRTTSEYDSVCTRVSGRVAVYMMCVVGY